MSTARKLGFYTDPHVGVRRSSNMTPKSAARFRENVWVAAQGALQLCRQHADVVVCLGDLFDTFSNNERDLLRGLELARATDLVIGGNHDVTARLDSVSSLDVVADAGQEEVFIAKAPYDTAFFEYFSASVDGFEETAGVYVVPHTTTQDLFEQSLELAKIDMQARGEHANLLLLHCNYDLRRDLGDQALVLMKEQAQALLNAGFDFILTGHEHSPVEDLSGRMVVLGNTYPLAMHETGERRVAVFDIIDKTLEYIRIPSLSRINYVIDEAGMLQPDGAPTSDDPIGFVTVEGEVSAEGFKLAQSQVRELWKQHPDMVALRNQLRLKGASFIDREHQVVQMEPLKDRIRRDLEGSPDMLAEYDRISAQISH